MDLTIVVVVPGVIFIATESRPIGTTSPPSTDGEKAGDQATPAQPDSPLVSTLPTEKPQFALIVRKFVGRLAEQLDAMDRALATGDCQELAQLAHWLKGSGGNVGFNAFCDPSRRLEELARSEQVDQIDSAISELRALAARIVPPPVGDTSTEPVRV